MNMYITIIFGISIIFMIFGTPVFMYRGICRLSKGELSKSDKVVGFVPILNLIKSDTLYNGHMGFLSLASILFVLSVIGILLCNKFIVSAGVASLYLFAKIVTVLAVSMFILFYVANCTFVFQVIHDSDTIGPLFMLLAVFIYPIGQYFIGGYLNGAIAEKVKEGESII